MYLVGLFNCRLSYVSYRFAVVCRNRSGLSAAQLVVCGQAGAGSIAYRVGPALRFGVTIGSNRELIVNFGRFGWQAAVIACLGVAGSFAAVFVVRRYFFRKGGSDER